MRHFYLVVMLVFTLSSPALCRHSRYRARTTARISVEHELIDLEKRWNEAFLRNDVATLKSIMADDIVIVYGDGSRATRAEDIASIGKGEQISTSIQDEFHVRVFGDAAVVMSRLTATGLREGKQFRAQFRYIDVYEKRGGRWQCTITQNTHIGKVTL